MKYLKILPKKLIKKKFLNLQNSYVYEHNFQIVVKICKNLKIKFWNQIINKYGK